MIFIADHAFRCKRFFVGRLRARRTQLYCVGTAKSGTHSICSIFSKNVAARHEWQAADLVDKFFAWQDRRISDGEMREWIHARDRELALEVDSSWFNVLVLEFLAGELPDARFLLTMRDCYAWLNSEFKRVLNRPSQDPWRVKIRKFLYDREGAVYAPEEQLLKTAGLYPVDCYLSRWTAHNEKVLATVPAERLMVVRTNHIRQRAHKIADFAGLPRHAVRPDRSHAYRNPVPHDIIREIDRDFLERKIEQHCRPLMNRFFPEIKTLDDAKL
jgi:hypothetical protein